MKTLLCSLLFLGFLTSGFATNGNTNSQQLLHAEDGPCISQYVQDMDALLDAGYGFETANAIATLDFKDCLDKHYPLKDNLQKPS